MRRVVAELGRAVSPGIGEHLYQHVPHDEGRLRQVVRRALDGATEQVSLMGEDLQVAVVSPDQHLRARVYADAPQMFTTETRRAYRAVGNPLHDSCGLRRPSSQQLLACGRKW